MKISSNVYVLDLPTELDISATFNVDNTDTKKGRPMGNRLPGSMPSYVSQKGWKTDMTIR